jgi:hypothetical protein
MDVRSSREFEGLLIGTDDWPIILMEFPERRIADTALHSALRFLEDLMGDAEKASEKTFQITDLTRMHELAGASQRKYASEWLRRTRALQCAASFGGANVTPSTILRGLITAINWVQSASTPTVFVATRKEAIAAAIEMFDHENAPLRPDLLARLTR